MTRALRKTGARTRRFLADALTWRLPQRQNAVVAWSLVGGSIWFLGNLTPGAIEIGTLIAGVYLVLVLAAVCAIDARFGIIPDGLNLALATGGMADYTLEHGGELYAGILEAAAVFLAVAAFRSAFRALRGYDGLGFGDVKFLAAASLWIGFTALPGAILISVGSALAAILLLNAPRYAIGGRDAIPFGPHLAAGVWLTWITGQVWTSGIT